MGEPEFLRTLGWMIVSSAVLLLLVRRLSMPSIVVFLVAGLLLGPILGVIDLTAAFGGHHAAGVSGAIALMSELGIALLLFMVGLELSLERIKDVGKVAAVAGIAQISVTATIGYGLSWAFDFTHIEAAILAMALTFSSTVVVVKLVDQRKETDTLHGQIAVGVLLVQDVVVIIALTFIAGLGGDGGGAATGDGMALNLAKAFGGMMFMLIGSILASRYLLPAPFKWASRRAEMLLLWSLALCFTYVTAAMALSLSPEIGAFLAGMSLAQLDCAHALTRRLQALMNFFIAIFFVTLGAQMQLSEAGSQIVPALTFAAFVIVTKPIVLMLAIAKLGYNQETAFKERGHARADQRILLHPRGGRDGGGLDRRRGPGGDRNRRAHHDRDLGLPHLLPRPDLRVRLGAGGAALPRRVHLGGGDARWGGRRPHDRDRDEHLGARDRAGAQSAWSPCRRDR